VEGGLEKGSGRRFEEHEKVMDLDRTEDSP